MNGYRKQQNKSNKRKKRRVVLICFWTILIISFAVFGSTVFGNMGSIVGGGEKEKKTDVSDNKPEEHTEKEDITTNAPVKTGWNLINANPWNKLPQDFTVNLTNLNNGQAIDSRAYPDLQAMMDDARAEGLSPLICSSFRSPEKQQYLFNNQIKKYKDLGYSPEDAQTEAAKWVAVPGTGEHQTGLAVDIVATSNQLLEKTQEDTAEQKWLMHNSYKYGFILRYPSDKTDITGIEYEPWHYRYVGKTAAKEIYEKGICLEEYLQ